MKKGCLIALGSLFLLFCAGIFSIYLLAQQYEKQPKKPGEGELWIAETFIRSYEDSEASGNTPDAVAFAKQYARDLRLSRQVLFTEGKAGGASLTKGNFLTYCFLGDDSLAVLVHVPELRRYSEDAKVTLGEYAWTLAASQARAQFPEVKRLAVGLKGVLNYSTIYTGIISSDDNFIEGIEKRHPAVSSEVLWPFFSGKTKPQGGAAASP